MKVYIDDVEETTAYEITVNWLMNGLSSATFSVPDIHLDGTHSGRDNWDALIDTADIKILGENNKIIFIGFIEKIDGDRELILTCKSSLGKFKWYDIAPGSSNFKLFEGKVRTTPADYDLLCEDPEGNLPSWATDEFEDKYAIISDTTTGASDEEIEYFNDPDTIVGRSQIESIDANETNSYLEVKSSPTGDADKWEGTFYNNEYLHKVMLMSLLLENYTIPEGANITTIDITITFSITPSCGAYSDLFGTEDSIFVSLGPTSSTPYGVRECKFTYPESSGDGPTEYFYEVFTIEVGSNWASHFTKGDNYFEGGWFGLIFPSWEDLHAIFGYQSWINVDWAACQITINFDTINFDTLNLLVQGNTATELNFIEDLNAEGVAEGDTVLIGTPMANAFEAIKYSASGLPSGLPLLSYPTLDKGIASDYLGVSGYKLLYALKILNTLELYQNYEAGDIIYLKKEIDLLQDGSLTGFKTIKGWESTNQIYGTISVWWSGKTDGPNPVVFKKSPWNGNPKNFSVIRKDIITWALAYETASDLADKYYNDRPSIPLSFSTWKFIKPGFLYDFTLNGVNYVDQICRRVTYSYSKNRYKITAFLGGGSTPSIEAIGIAIGKLDRRITDIQSIELTGSFLPANSWSQITNKPSTYPATAHKTSHENGGSDEIGLDGSQITSGEVAEVRIAPLDADKITTGVLQLARIPDLPASRITSGELAVDRIPGLPTSKITSGSFADAFIDNNITLDNITQITARSHTDLSDKGTKTHTQIDAFIASKAAALGLATLNAASQLINSQVPGYLATGLKYIDIWDASGGSYPSGSHNVADYYICSKAGTVNSIAYVVGDAIIWDGFEWDLVKTWQGDLFAHSLDAYKIQAYNSRIQNLEIRGKHLHEIQGIMNLGADWLSGGMPPGWAVNGTWVTLEVVTYSDIEKVLKMEKDYGDEEIYYDFTPIQSFHFDIQVYISTDFTSQNKNCFIYIEDTQSDGSGYGLSSPISCYIFINSSSEIIFGMEGLPSNSISFSITPYKDDKLHKFSIRCDGNKNYTAWADDVYKGTFAKNQQWTFDRLRIDPWGGLSNLPIYITGIGLTAIDENYIPFSNEEQEDLGKMILDDVEITDILISTDSFVDSDNKLMTAKKIKDYVQAPEEDITLPSGKNLQEEFKGTIRYNCVRNKSYGSFTLDYNWLLSASGYYKTNSKYVTISNTSTRFTLVKSGWYLFNLNLLLKNMSVDDNYRLLIRKNGAAFKYIMRWNGRSGFNDNYFLVNRSIMLSSDGDDYYEFNFVCDNASANFEVNTSATYDSLSLEYKGTY